MGFNSPKQLPEFPGVSLSVGWSRRQPRLCRRCRPGRRAVHFVCSWDQSSVALQARITRHGREDARPRSMTRADGPSAAGAPTAAAARCDRERKRTSGGASGLSRATPSSRRSRVSEGLVPRRARAVCAPATRGRPKLSSRVASGCVQEVSGGDEAVVLERATNPSRRRCVIPNLPSCVT